MDASDDPELDAFLAEQSRLAELQAAQPSRWRQVILDHLRWDDVRQRLPAVLELILVLAAVGVVVALAAMDRGAHARDPAVVQPFSPANTRQGLKF